MVGITVRVIVKVKGHHGLRGPGPGGGGRRAGVQVLGPIPGGLRGQGFRVRARARVRVRVRVRVSVRVQGLELALALGLGSESP